MSDTNTCVLVVEDDDAIRELVALLLEDAGHPVLLASDGAVALDLLDVQGSNGVGVILLDMSMPVMDGWTFARAYHALEGPHAPLLAFTAAQDAQGRAESIGAAGFLCKPFTCAALLAQVERYVPRAAVRVGGEAG